MPFWSLLPVVMLGSSILCWVLIKLGGARFLDQPVARSAHTHATPRGGGASVVIAFYIFVGTLYAFGHLTSEQLMVLMCAFPVAVTGFIDDLRPLPVHFRLPLHLTVAVFALLLLGPVPEPFFSGWLLLPFWLQSLLLILALVWLLNLYNFMDGIDT